MSPDTYPIKHSGSNIKEMRVGDNDIDDGYYMVYDNSFCTPFYNTIPMYDIEVISSSTLKGSSLGANLKGFQRFESENLFGDSISTYAEDPLTHQLFGEPIADTFLGLEYNNFVLVAVADGCGWGQSPCKAAQDAIRGFQGKLISRLSEDDNPIRTTVEVAHNMLVSLMFANHEVIKGAVGGDPLAAGSTTLLGGLIVKIKRKKPSDPKYAFIGVSVGDCKIYRFSKAKLTLADPALGSPRGTNPSDPGGRLGLVQVEQPDVPDLRNMQIINFYLEEDDMIFLFSDGVHDNFDPVVLGQWESQKINEQGQKIAWSLTEIDTYKVLNSAKIIETANSKTPTQIGKAFLQHCDKTNKLSNEYMQKEQGNKGGRMNVDYKRFPGKQDHATCLIYRNR